MYAEKKLETFADCYSLYLLQCTLLVSINKRYRTVGLPSSMKAEGTGWAANRQSAVSRNPLHWILNEEERNKRKDAGCYAVLKLNADTDTHTQQHKTTSIIRNPFIHVIFFLHRVLFLLSSCYFWLTVFCTIRVLPYRRRHSRPTKTKEWNFMQRCQTKTKVSLLLFTANAVDQFFHEKRFFLHKDRNNYNNVESWAVLVHFHFQMKSVQ